MKKQNKWIDVPLLWVLMGLAFSIIALGQFLVDTGLTIRLSN